MEALKDSEAGPIEESGKCECPLVMLLDGYGTHAALGYMIPGISHAFRQGVDAATAMIPAASPIGS